MTGAMVSGGIKFAESLQTLGGTLSEGGFIIEDCSGGLDTKDEPL